MHLGRIVPNTLTYALILLCKTAISRLKLLSDLARASTKWGRNKICFWRHAGIKRA